MNSTGGTFYDLSEESDSDQSDVDTSPSIAKRKIKITVKKQPAFSKKKQKAPVQPLKNVLAAVGQENIPSHRIEDFDTDPTIAEDDESGDSRKSRRKRKLAGIFLSDEFELPKLPKSVAGGVAKSVEYECEHCGKKFSTQQGLSQHSTYHVSKRFNCWDCGSRFSSLKAFRKHRETHNDMRFFKCDHCEKLFYGKDLQNHLKTHEFDESDSEEESPSKPYLTVAIDKTEYYEARHQARVRSYHEEVAAAQKGEASGKESDGPVTSVGTEEAAQPQSAEGLRKRITCKQCHVQVSTSEIASHMRQHAIKPVEEAQQQELEPLKKKCKYCDKLIPSKNLPLHVRRHEVERRVVQSVDGRSKTAKSTPTKRITTPVKHSPAKRTPLKPKQTQQHTDVSSEDSGERRSQRRRRLPLRLKDDEYDPEENGMKDSSGRPVFSGYLKCEACPLEFYTDAALNTHARNAHPELEPYECFVCSRAFYTFDSFTKHEDMHERDDLYFCMECNIFIRIDKRQAHISNHELFECYVCGKSLSNKSALIMHEKSHSSKPKSKAKRKSSVIRYFCHLCEDSFSQKKFLNQHIRLLHSESCFQCEFCFKSFLMKPNLISHLRQCEAAASTPSKSTANVAREDHSDPPNEGDVAQQLFDDDDEESTGLIIMQEDDDEESFVNFVDNNGDAETEGNPALCEICNVLLQSKALLISHIKKLHPESYHNCTFCGNVYFTQKGLDEHIDNCPKAPVSQEVADFDPTADFEDDEVIEVSQSEGEDEDGDESSVSPVKDRDDSTSGPANCEWCDMKFPQVEEFHGHMNDVHPEVEPYQCDNCGKQYFTEDRFNKHMRWHDKMRPARCDLCSIIIPACNMRKHKVSAHYEIHECSVCQQQLKTKSALVKHMQLHREKSSKKSTPSGAVAPSRAGVASSEEWKCGHCGATFGSRLSYSKHMNTSHPVARSLKKKIKCYICSSYIPAGKMTEHRRKHFAVTYDCEHCDLKFKNEDALRIHVYVHTGERPFQCEICGKGYISKGSLSKHLLRHNRDAERIGKGQQVNPSDGSQLECNICGVMVKASKLARHRKTHFIGYECSTCGRHFPSQEKLVSHEMTHNDEKPFQCIVCSEAFKSEQLLMKHVGKEHESDKHHRCMRCEQTFFSRTMLEKHLEQPCHPPAEKPPTSSQKSPRKRKKTGFTCETCKGHFYGSFTQHMMMHSGELPGYPCRVCQKLFPDEKQVSKHFDKVHSVVDRPYECEFCDKRFSHPADLSDHLRRHAKESSKQASQSAGTPSKKHSPVKKRRKREAEDNPDEFTSSRKKSKKEKVSLLGNLIKTKKKSSKKKKKSKSDHSSESISSPTKKRKYSASPERKRGF